MQPDFDFSLDDLLAQIEDALPTVPEALEVPTNMDEELTDNIEISSSAELTENSSEVPEALEAPINNNEEPADSSEASSSEEPAAVPSKVPEAPINNDEEPADSSEASSSEEPAPVPPTVPEVPEAPINNDEKLTDNSEITATEEPVAEPEEPAAEPETPATEPEALTVEPEELTAKPEELTVEPEELAAEPEESADIPSAEPINNEKPAETPSPAPEPEEPVAYQPIPTAQAPETEPDNQESEPPVKVFDPRAFAVPKPPAEKPLQESLFGPEDTKPATDKTIEIDHGFLKKHTEKPLTGEQADLARTQPITFRAMQNSPLFFERPGIVTGKSVFGKTGDLSALPEIMAADEALSSMKKAEDAAKPKEEPDDAQMIFPGFAPETEPRVLVDEEAAENELKENRSQKVESFRLEGVEEPEKEINTEILDELEDGGGEGMPVRRFSGIKARARANRQSVEYNRPQDKNRVLRFLEKKRVVTLVSTVICAVCTLALLFTGAIPAVADAMDAGASAQWLGSMPVSYFVSLLLLIVCAFGGVPIYARGVTCFFRGSGKPNACTAVFAALAASFIQLIAASLAYDGEKVPCFALLAALSVTLFGVGNLISLDTIAKNFLFLTELDKNELYAADTIENTADVKRLAQDSVIGGSDIRYSSKAKFAGSFLSYSFAGDSTDDLCAWLVPVTAAVSFFLAVLVGLVKKDVAYAFSIFGCAMAMSVPVSAAIALALPLSRADNQLREDGAFLSSYAAAFEYETTNVIAVDAADLFPASCCDIHGMKPFGGVRIDEAILTAASMILAVGGPIGSLLSNVVMGRKELLMPVEHLIYEDRLGLSGCIRNRCVVLGNRRMMENHNIEIPHEAKEARYARHGRRVLYLADNGKLIALFVVSYGTDRRIVEQVRKIEENGINILVRATDPNITEKTIAMTFGIPGSSVKVVSNAAGEVLTNYAERVNAKAEAKLVHNGSPLAFFHAVRTAGWLCGVAGRINAQQIACCAAGLLIVAILALFTASVSPLVACLCQLMWVLVGLAVPLVGRE